METIPQYIERKHNPKLIRYLDRTYEGFSRFSTAFSCIKMTSPHRDQIRRLFVAQSDKFRKAMGKKIPAEMQKQKEKLIEGFMEYPENSKRNAQINSGRLIEPFAAYGFRKAHAASYGRVSYQTAYMKANYPVEYLAALLTADSGDTEQIALFVAEAKRMGITVLPPDVNESGTDLPCYRDEVNILRKLR